MIERKRQKMKIEEKFINLAVAVTEIALIPLILLTKFVKKSDKKFRKRRNF